MMSCDSGEIVLVHYPFTDFSTLKQRPAVVLSPKDYADRFGDVIVMPLTSQPESNTALALSQWRSAGLIKPSWVKPIIGTLSIHLIRKRLGKLVDADVSCVRAALATMISATWVG
jgi:mRNA-degrading endonuclease toxin of MazEF toxin-antitoxin module